MKAELYMKLGNTWALCGGRVIADAVMDEMVKDLDSYPPKEVSKALDRCKRECIHGISLPAIISRIDDGRPGADEAWGMLPMGEQSSAVWTPEMSAAFFQVYQMENHIAMRQAFKQAYDREVIEARARNIAVSWDFSAGHDPVERDRVFLSAVTRGLLPEKWARRIRPELTERITKALPAPETKQLPAAEPEVEEPNEAELTTLVGQMGRKMKP